MQVKVFEADDMASGLKMVKEALGPDALILSTRTVRRGRLGMMGRPIMEITAAVDTTWDERPTPARPAPARPAPVRQEPRRPAASPQPSRFAAVGDDDLTYEQIWNQPEHTEPERPQPERPPAGREGEDIRDEITELRSLVQSLSSRLAGMEQPPPAGVSTPAGPARGGGYDPALRLLRARGLDEQTAALVVRAARQETGDPGSLAPGRLAELLSRQIASLLHVDSDLLSRRQGRQRRIALVGPTGAGKTTTIAKIAANYLHRFGGRVALVTIDTYRIAAVEQLKVYGEIMRLPVEVVIRPSQLREALRKHRDCELILIDTAGRSPRNEHELQDMVPFLEPSLGIETHLLLSATTRESELLDTIRRFGHLEISRCIFSKIDECGQLGVLLNVHCANRTPISLVTNGQRVPEDIIVPVPETLAGLIMNDHRTGSNG